MNKAILVMDMPSGCNECDIMCKQYYATIKKEELKCGTKPHNCPLKPLPKKKDICGAYNYEYYANGGMSPSEKYGYNACVDEILGSRT